MLTKNVKRVVLDIKTVIAILSIKTLKMDLIEFKCLFYHRNYKKS